MICRFICLAILACMVSLHVVADDFYTVTINLPITAKSEKVSKLFKHAFSDMVVRLSGLEETQFLETVHREIKRSGDYVNRIQFLSLMIKTIAGLCSMLALARNYCCNFFRKTIFL